MVTTFKFKQIIPAVWILICFCFNLSELCFGQAGPVINVTIETDRHISLPHQRRSGIFRPLKLTFAIPEGPLNRTTPITVSRGAIQAGAGLVVEHITPNGARSIQRLEPRPVWFVDFETLLVKSATVPMYFDVQVLPGANFNFSAYGIYHISYEHPWLRAAFNPADLRFRSNRLTIACVTEQRLQELRTMLEQDTELALLSYQFKNQPRSLELPKYGRDKLLQNLDKAIIAGMRQDVVLFLLGSPESIRQPSPSERKMLNFNEQWFYETSPVGGYDVNFRNGRVVKPQRIEAGSKEKDKSL